ncbi:hypothetical protein GLOIN_2v1765163 [Rhizophagus irregularis DAOM 181602=DAOM 197198]|nr:hypothetical protein GLOIN_2v1765163 [Rhizophagus irregularis DAOM 181602=DAOM 197198]
MISSAVSYNSTRLASDNRNKTITNINKSSSNIQQAVEGTATPIHERAQTTNINKSSSNIQQAVEGTATPIHKRAQTTNINKNSSNTQQPFAAPSHERAQSVKERYKNLRLLDSSNTQPPSAAPTVVATKIARLREDNEFLAGVNAEFSSENDDLKEEVNELKMKLEQYQIRLSSESLDVIDVPEERLAKWFKSDGSKKGKKTVHYAKNQPKEEQEEQHEKEVRVCNFVILGRIVQSLYFYTSCFDLKIEMKMILKTIKPNNNLDNNETFNSPKNVEIHSRLIPELQRAMFLNYKPSVAQLTNWLSALHKSRRSQI